METARANRQAAILLPQALGASLRRRAVPADDAAPRWTRSAGTPATSCWSPATPMSIIRASAWRSSAGCWRRRASASASSPSRTGRAPSRSGRSGRPTLFFGVTGGNMDSMVNRYTADRRLRHNDSYTPGGEGGKRPDRCVIVYAQRCREAYPRRADRARRHRELAAAHRALRLLVGQGAPLDPRRCQGRHSALRQCRARGGRSRASPRRRRRAAAARRHSRRRVVQARAGGLSPNCTPTISTPPTKARSCSPATP